MNACGIVSPPFQCSAAPDWQARRRSHQPSVASNGRLAAVAEDRRGRVLAVRVNGTRQDAANEQFHGGGLRVRVANLILILALLIAGIACSSAGPTAKEQPEDTAKATVVALTTERDWLAAQATALASSPEPASPVTMEPTLPTAVVSRSPSPVARASFFPVDGDGSRQVETGTALGTVVVTGTRIIDVFPLECPDDAASLQLGAFQVRCERPAAGRKFLIVNLRSRSLDDNGANRALQEQTTRNIPPERRPYVRVDGQQLPAVSGGLIFGPMLWFDVPADVLRLELGWPSGATVTVAIPA